MTTLRVAPGEGYLIADARSLLFLPAWSDVLATAFMDAPDHQRTRAVSSAAVEAGFELPPFVCVTWLDELYVMVFGEIEVTTSAPTLPMLTGAGSRTWVERTVDLSDDVDVEVRCEHLDDRLVLRSGVASAGGFRLELCREPSDPDAEPSTGGVGAIDTSPLPRSGASAPMATPDQAHAAARSTPTGSGNTNDTDVTGDTPRSTSASADETAAAGRRRPGPLDQVQDHEDLESYDDIVDDDATLPPPVVSMGIDAPDGSNVWVEARRCAAGHANPPSCVRCAICDEPVDADPTSVVHVARQSLGGIRLDDGTWHDLSDELLLGRNPSSDSSPERAAMTRVTTAGDKVSRVHVEVRMQGWDVLVGDCGSTNGTFVVPHSGGTVVQVEPGRLQIVEDGATVYFGSRSFQVVGRRRAP